MSTVVRFPPDKDCYSTFYIKGSLFEFGKCFGVYLLVSFFSIKNFSSVYFTIKMADEAPTVDGGPFSNPYEFSQLHFHWGDNDSYGSEGKCRFVLLSF